jgi:hypothetical protein
LAVVNRAIDRVGRSVHRQLLRRQELNRRPVIATSPRRSRRADHVVQPGTLRSPDR